MDIAFEKENVTFDEALKAVKEGKTLKTKVAYACFDDGLYLPGIRDRFGGYVADRVPTFEQAGDFLNRC